MRAHLSSLEVLGWVSVLPLLVTRVLAFHNSPRLRMSLPNVFNGIQVAGYDVRSAALTCGAELTQRRREHFKIDCLKSPPYPQELVQIFTRNYLAVDDTISGKLRFKFCWMSRKIQTKTVLLPK